MEDFLACALDFLVCDLTREGSLLEQNCLCGWVIVTCLDLVSLCWQLCPFNFLEHDSRPTGNKSRSFVADPLGRFDVAAHFAV